MNKIRIPDDISIIGFDNHPVSHISNPALTTVTNDLAKLGEIAAENIFSITENSKPLQFENIIKPIIIERDSVSKL